MKRASSVLEGGDEEGEEERDPSLSVRIDFVRQKAERKILDCGAAAYFDAQLALDHVKWDELIQNVAPRFCQWVSRSTLMRPSVDDMWSLVNTWSRDNRNNDAYLHTRGGMLDLACARLSLLRLTRHHHFAENVTPLSSPSSSKSDCAEEVKNGDGDDEEPTYGSTIPLSPELRSSDDQSNSAALAVIAESERLGALRRGILHGWIRCVEVYPPYDDIPDVCPCWGLAPADDASRSIFRQFWELGMSAARKHENPFTVAQMLSAVEEMESDLVINKKRKDQGVTVTIHEAFILRYEYYFTNGPWMRFMAICDDYEIEFPRTITSLVLGGAASLPKHFQPNATVKTEDTDGADGVEEQRVSAMPAACYNWPQIFLRMVAESCNDRPPAHSLHWPDGMRAVAAFFHAMMETLDFSVLEEYVSHVMVMLMKLPRFMGIPSSSPK